MRGSESGSGKGLILHGLLKRTLAWKMFIAVIAVQGSPAPLPSKQAGTTKESKKNTTRQEKKTLGAFE